MLVIIIILTASGASVGLAYGFDANLSTDVIRSLGAYINALMGLQIVIAANANESKRLLRVTFGVLLASVCIGLLQASALLDIDWFIQTLIPRGQADALLDSGRGVTLLATEPARAGVELVLMYATCRFTFLNHRNSIAMDLFFIGFQVLVIKSASAVALSALLLAIIHTNLRYVWVVGILAYGAGVALELNPDSQWLCLCTECWSSGAAKQYSIWQTVGQILSIITFINFGLTHPFGAGVKTG